MSEDSNGDSGSDSSSDSSKQTSGPEQLAASKNTGSNKQKEGTHSTQKSNSREQHFAANSGRKSSDQTVEKGGSKDPSDSQAPTAEGESIPSSIDAEASPNTESSGGKSGSDDSSSSGDE